MLQESTENILEELIYIKDKLQQLGKFDSHSWKLNRAKLTYTNEYQKLIDYIMIKQVWKCKDCNGFIDKLWSLTMDPKLFLSHLHVIGLCNSCYSNRLLK